MNYQDFILPELLVLIPVLYLVGVGLKKSTVADKWIPAMLGGLGVVLSALYVLATADIQSTQDIAVATFTAVTQGVLVAGASVYANQVVKQASKDE